MGTPGRRRLSDPPPNAGDYEPAWSSDGRLIAFQRSGEIAVMNDDASALEIVDVASREIRKLTWGPGALRSGTCGPN